MAFGLCLAAGQASAGVTFYSGTSCEPHQSAVHNVEFGPFGVHNINTTDFTVQSVSCPIPVASGAILNSVNVRIFDRKNGGGLVNTDVTCQIFFQDNSGTTFNGPTGGAINFFSVPNSTSFTMNANFGVSGATMVCKIPNQTASGTSHIVNYKVTTTP